MNMRKLRPLPIPGAKSGQRLVGVTDAAKYMGVSRWTMHKWINTGKVPFVQLPSSVSAGDFHKKHVDLNDLDAIIERNKDRNA